MVDEDRELVKLHSELEKLKKELEKERVWTTCIKAAFHYTFITLFQKPRLTIHIATHFSFVFVEKCIHIVCNCSYFYTASERN